MMCRFVITHIVEREKMINLVAFLVSLTITALAVHYASYGIAVLNAGSALLNLGIFFKGLQ